MESPRTPIKSLSIFVLSVTVIGLIFSILFYSRFEANTNYQNQVRFRELNYVAKSLSIFIDKYIERTKTSGELSDVNLKKFEDCFFGSASVIGPESIGPAQCDKKNDLNASMYNFDYVVIVSGDGKKSKLTENKNSSTPNITVIDAMKLVDKSDGYSNRKSVTISGIDFDVYTYAISVNEYFKELCSEQGGAKSEKIYYSNAGVFQSSVIERSHKDVGCKSSDEFIYVIGLDNSQENLSEAIRLGYPLSVIYMIGAFVFICILPLAKIRLVSFNQGFSFSDKLFLSFL